MVAMAATRIEAIGATERRMLVNTASDVLATRVTPAASPTVAHRGRPPCQTMARETTTTLRTSATATATKAPAHDRASSKLASPATNRKTPTATTHSAPNVTRFNTTLRGA